MNKEFVYRNNYFLRALEENENIDENFRELIKSTLSGIYYGLGEKNFLRWINRNNMSKRLKEYVVEIFSEEDLEKLPNAAGFYTYGTNRVKFTEAYKDDENTARHETMHFATDFSITDNESKPNYILNKTKSYGRFLNEGLTEYLNREIEKIIKQKQYVNYAYRKNVDFVEFLHKILGDSFIKSYLSGRTEKYNEELSSYITKDGSESISELNNFENILETIHRYLHPNKTPTDEEKKKQKEKCEKEDYPKINEYISNISVNYIRKKAHNLEYLKDGKIDYESIYKDIGNLQQMLRYLFQNSKFGMTYMSEEYNSFLENIINESVKVALRECSLDINQDENLIINGNITKSGNIATYIPPRVDINKMNLISKNLTDINLFNSIILNRSNQNSGYVKDEKFDLTSFMMDISLILSKFKFDKDSKEKALDLALKILLPSDVNKDFIKDVFDKYSDVFSEFARLDQQDKIGTVDTKFVKISDDCFFTKRDNNFTVIKVDNEKNTIILNAAWPEIDRHRQNLLNSGDKKENVTCYKCSSGHYLSKNVSIVCNDDFSNVTVNNKNAIVIDGYPRIIESLIADEALRSVNESSRKYVTKLKADGPELPKVPLIPQGKYGVVHKENEILNFRKIREDIDKATELLPEEYADSILCYTLDRILKTVYSANLEEFPEFKNLIEDKRVLENPLNKEYLGKLMDFSEKINNHKRRDINGYSYVFFPSTDADNKKIDKYFLDCDKAKARKDFSERLNFFEQMYYDDCIVEKSNSRVSSENYVVLDGMYYIQRYIIRNDMYETGVAKKVDYKNFVQYIKNELVNIPDKDKEKYVSKLISNGVYYWYGFAKRADDNYSDVIEGFNDLILEQVKSVVFEDRELDLEIIEQNEKEYYETIEKCADESEKNLKSARKTFTPKFEFEETRIAYEAIEEISKDDTISEENKKITIDILTKQNNSRIAKKRKMESFAKLALSGDKIPSEQDVKSASSYLAYKEKEEERSH